MRKLHPPNDARQPPAEHDDGRDGRRDHLHLRRNRRGDGVEVRQRKVPQVVLKCVAERWHGK